LVVIHRHDNVVRAADRLREECVGRLRAFDVHPRGTGGFDRRKNVLALLRPEQPAIARVGIQTRDADVRPLDAELFARIVG
jgi:hypothetical protein